jgi:hypothetical protein
MALSPNERKIFYSHFLGLLSHINDKYNLIPSFGHPKNPEGLCIEEIITLKNKLWGNVKIIDKYVDSIKKIPKEQIQIVKEWKKKISGRFIIVKHLKNYSVFLDSENDLLYGVIGLNNPISDLIPDVMLPVMADAVLLPFNDVIIYDSVLYTLNVQFGPHIRKTFKEQYTEIKKEKGIIVSIE